MEPLRDWLGMHAKLADVYMCALAGGVARDRVEG
jgi:hypothetical protein